MPGCRKAKAGSKKCLLEHVTEKQQPACDAIVVLGAAVWKGGQPSPALRRRVLHAVALLKQDRSRVLLVSGGLGRHPPTEAEVMRDLAVAEGVAAESIIVEDRATTTFESVLECSRILHQKKWSSAIVVTDPYHLFRAIVVFRCFGI